MTNGALPSAVAETMAMLWSPLLAVTTHHAGRHNGLIVGTGVFASLVPEAPRIAIELTKSSHTLGMRSGHDSDKMAAFGARQE
jgi:flavin reductase (DIM6/NTAB) family NADH-FMN oxidoreductase RutF